MFSSAILLSVILFSAILSSANINDHILSSASLVKLWKKYASTLSFDWR